MSKKVLIAYGSRYGSTEEVSVKFKKIMENKGFDADLVNLKAKKGKIPNINNYSGVLIGSSIRISRWTKEAKKFLKKNAREINSSKIMTGVFLCSGEAADPVKRPEAVDKYLVQVFNDLGLELGDHILYDAFGGVFDLSTASNLGWMNKKILNMVADEDPNIVRGEKNDLRDWDQINGFIDSFIRKLESSS
ncbi:MAG: flavodoxin domain-containing protein [Candidatus Odinarchaeota archaeon]